MLQSTIYLKPLSDATNIKKRSSKSTTGSKHHSSSSVFTRMWQASEKQVKVHENAPLTKSKDVKKAGSH